MNRYTGEMKKIDLEKYPRRALLEAFRNRDIPVFSVTGTIDITHLGGVGGLAWTAEFEFDAALIGPFVHDLGDEFAAIVDFDNAGQAAPGCNVVECIHNILSFQALAHLDGQALPV